MEHPGFFPLAGPFRISDLVPRIEAEAVAEDAGGKLLSDVKALSDAGPSHLTFLDNKKYLPQLETTTAGACLVQPAFANRVPSKITAIPCRSPYRSFALALMAFYPSSRYSMVAGASKHAVDPSARIEADVVIEPGAIVGPEAWIGRGARIAAGAVIGYRCSIGRETFVGPGASIVHALVGDRVIIHGGVRIGQDGFGFAMGPGGHLKVPQIGRVIVQDDVEIGANTCIDRGALKDTIIGEGTKIDNLVQIGHNVVMGRHCVIVGQTGIAGSAELGDFVVMGGQSGLVGHIKVGSGAQIAGSSHAKDDIPAGTRVGGTPARPLREWAREIAFVRRGSMRGFRSDD